MFATFVIFSHLPKRALKIYARVLNPEKMDSMLHSSSTAESLALIGILTKISNSPILLKAKAQADAAKRNGDVSGGVGVQEALALLPSNARITDVSLSGTNQPCYLQCHSTDPLIAREINSPCSALTSGTKSTFALIGQYRLTVNVQMSEAH